MPAHEALEGLQDGSEVGEGIGMVHLDVRHDGAGRVVGEEVPSELVRLDHEGRTIPRTHRCAPCLDDGPDLHGRVESGRDQEMAQERGRRRLAMRPGHGQPDPARRGHELPDELLPGDDLDSIGLRASELGVVGDGAQGGADRHAADAHQVRGIVLGEPRDARASSDGV